MSAEAVDGAVREIPGDDAAAGAFLVHDQIEREVLDEELGLVLEALLVERVQDGVPGAIGGSTGALCASLAEMGRHAAERTLVDFSVLGA